MSRPRSAGILLHITSLPSRFGIGDMGPAAFQFVNFLRDAGQSIWQILPICPPTKGNSPYSSYSAFAGNMLLVSPESMVADGWLSPTELKRISDDFDGIATADPSQVDFDSVESFKRRVMEVAFQTFCETHHRADDFQSFCEKQAWWLDDFARFEALKEHFGEGDWTQWPPECRVPCTVASSILDEIEVAIEYSKFKQFLFESQWTLLKTYANQQGIQVCGDMPIFVALESADVWANQSQYQLDSAGRPTFVAGVPPDYFSETGQLWGNPLYDWQKMESDDFAWWCDRFRRASDQFDLLRVDHFRGFASYWKVPCGAETAAEGCWAIGPQDKPFIAAEKALGKLPIWAEDLGDIDQPVHDLRDRLGFPSMRVMQFGFDEADDDFHRHTMFPNHCIAYTGTHDNDTLMGWFHSRKTGNKIQEDVLAGYLDGESETHFQIIKLLYESAANVAIVPLQDVLGMGGEARMNVPGLPKGNWRWRVVGHLLTPELAFQIRTIASESGRLNSLAPTLV